jgi:hypothetical protein
MMNARVQLIYRSTLSIVCALLVLQFGVPVFAQGPPPSPEQAGPPAPALSPDQLANLVAPIALYPDSLLSQVLVAATYPLEVVEAGQWLQQNRNLRGAQLVEAARQQNWDASIQALVVFPDVIGRLSSNIHWTTDLGNAFLAQQADVMDAVQDLRARARAAGKLDSSPQETVTTQTQGGQTVVEIQPANPQIVYVPTYNPEYIWGPPVYGYYPPLYYPQISFGFGFGPGIFVDAFFRGIGAFFGSLGWGGWGWGPSWFGHSLFVNNSFFHHYGFTGFRGDSSFQGRGGWTHDPAHRLGVPYSNGALANRFYGASGGRGGTSGTRFGGQGYTASRQSLPGRMNSGGNFGNRGSMGTNSAAPRSFSQQGAGSRGTVSPQSNSAQGWQRFSGPGSGTGQASTSNGRSSGTASGYRSSSPAYSTNGGYRSSSSYGGSAGNSGGGRAASSYRPSSPAYSTNGGYRSSSSYGGSAGNSGGGRAASSYRPSSSGSRGGGSVASHSSGGGGGSHSGGGGQSSHSSGGGGGHHR